MSVSFDNPLPFCPDSDPSIEVWDGVTYFVNGSSQRVPSNSSSEQTKVVGAGTEYPIAVPYATLVNWCKGVRYLKTDFSVAHDIYSSSFVSGDTYEWNSGPFTTESVSLVSSAYSSSFPAVGALWNPSVIMQDLGTGFEFSQGSPTRRGERAVACLANRSLFTVQPELYVKESFVFLDGAARIYDGEIYPRLGVSVSASDWFTVYLPTVSSFARDLSYAIGGLSSPMPPISGGTGTFLGLSIPLYISRNPTGFSYDVYPGSLEWAAVTAATVTVAAHDYFAFDPGDGDGPYCDTSDGSLIRAFGT